MLAGTCAALVAVYGATGAAELRRLEQMLADMLGDRAVTLVQGVEALAADRFERFAALGEASLSPTEPVPLEESVVHGLVAAARKLAAGAAPGQPGGTALQRFAAQEHVQAALLVSSGQDPFLPPFVRQGIRPVLDGSSEIALDIFGSAGEEDSPHFVAVRAPGGQRAAVLLLNATDLRHWALRAAVQTAVEDVGWREGVLYLEVSDGEGRTLGRGGMPALPPAAGAPRLVRRNGYGGEPYWEASVPFHLGTERVATARLGLAAQDADRLLGQSRRRTLATSGVLLAVGLLCVAVLYRVQERHHRGLKGLRGRLQRAQRLAALGKLGAGLAHEIRNPLNAIGLAAQRLAREHLPPDGPAREEFRHLIEVLRSEIRRLDALLEDFLRAAPDGRLDPHPASVGDLVREVATLFEAEASARGVRLVAEVPGGSCTAPIDRHRMQQALVNLVKNALEAIPGEGAVTLRAEALGRNEIRIRVEDTGAGIPGEHRPRIFDPDFTTKPRGLGLGLAIVYEIVRAHGGTLEVESQPGRGSRFDVILPRESAG